MADVQSLRSEDPRSLGRYELLGRLGEGAQGTVFLARDAASGAQVAVKLLRAHLSQDEASRFRFLREVAAAKRVARFCTAQVLDADLAGTRPYIVSEYIPGPSLAAVVRFDGPRGGTALERIAVNTATALAGIHRAGIVHRDFKAANVLLGPDGPVVIDFGIAKALGAVEAELTLPGYSTGTPAYMAPEQFSDGPVGPAADIFAWGVTMAFAATGALPFGAGQIPAVIHRILNEQPQLDGLTPPLRDLVAACLEKDPAARPTARQIVDRLLGGQDCSEAAAPAMPPSNTGTQQPAHGAVPMDAAAAAASRRDPAPPRPLRADLKKPSQPSGASGARTPAIAAPKPRRSHRGLAWTATAVAVLVLAGGAVAVKAFTGSPGAGKSSLLHAAAGALPSGAAPVASPVVPTATAKSAAPGASPRGAPAKAGAAVKPIVTAPANPSASAPAPTRPTASAQPTATSVPNPYTPTEVCGSGYDVIDSHALADGTIYLLYDSATGKNCVTTMRSDVSGKITMAATLKVEGGPSASDSGQYTYYAGPVALGAAATCVEWGGAIGSSSWMSSWSHCG